MKDKKVYRVHLSVGEKPHFVSQADALRDERPLCRAKAFYRYNRPDLGGFDMARFNPKDVMEIPDGLCLKCLSASEEKSRFTYQLDGTFVLDDKDIRARKQEDQAEMVEWDRRLATSSTFEELEIVLREAMAKLSGYKRTSARNWYDDAKELLRLHAVASGQERR